LPETWRQRFFFMGVGGNAGTLTPSVNAVDRVSALGKGYAVIVQDSGHIGNGTDAGWLKTPDGKRDAAKMVDFLYRAAHAVTVSGKQFATAYYAAPVQHAYFDGCSTGGRMAMMEAERYPTDFDGIIAGDPAMDYHSTILRFAVQKAALSTPAAYLTADTLKMVDKIVTARCDAIDGAVDGLVQNPASCPVKASDLICRNGATSDCLTPEQAAVLQSYTSPLRRAAGVLPVRRSVSGWEWVRSSRCWGWISILGPIPPGTNWWRRWTRPSGRPRPRTQRKCCRSFARAGR
jgi:hypothetical protein